MTILLPTKVEKIFEDSLDSIPSPSPLVKIQIMGGKICFQKFVDNSQQCFAFISQANFLVHDLNFTEGDEMESRLFS